MLSKPYACKLLDFVEVTAPALLQFYVPFLLYGWDSGGSSVASRHNCEKNLWICSAVSSKKLLSTTTSESHLLSEENYVDGTTDDEKEENEDVGIMERRNGHEKTTTSRERVIGRRLREKSD